MRRSLRRVLPLWSRVLVCVLLASAALAQGDVSSSVGGDVSGGVSSTVNSDPSGNSSATWRGEHEGAPLEVTVVARGHRVADDAVRILPWWRWGNTASDAYLFSFTPDGGVDLVLSFWPTPGRPDQVQATLYRPTGAARFGVAVALATPEGFSLPPGVDPALSVQPLRGGWWVAGRPNFNLVTRRYTRYEDTLLEWHGRVRAAEPGVPLWEQSQLANDPNPHLGYTRFSATVRADPEVAYTLASPLLPGWPYLSATRSVAHWGPNRPLVFETGSGELREFWAGFHIAGSYQFNSLSPPPATDFEAPFAFYRFDPEAGLHANLVLRSDVWPATSPFGPPLRGVARTAVRMTWTERDPELWRYSLTLLGNHPMTERVAIGTTRVRAVAYDAFPRWVARKPWKVATFVEATAGQRGSEGIYDYTVEDNYPVSFWAQGRSAEVPRSFAAPRLDARFIGPGQLAPGLRGEYSAVYRRTPQLYRSPVDGRVHLRYATGGVWNLGGGQLLRVANLDGDSYLDAWWRERLEPGATHARGGRLEEALYRVDDLLIHTGPAGVTFKRSAFAAASATPPVPVDRAAWEAFLAAGASAETARDPHALKEWLAAFSGATLELPGAAVRDLRNSATELRFILELGAASAPQGDLELPGFGAAAPGRYVVRYDRRARRWSQEAATPPRLEASLKPNLEAGVQGPRFAAFVPATLTLHVSNRGGVDLTGDAALRVGDRVLRRWQGLRFGGGGTFRETIPWTPETPGVQRATLRVGGQSFALGTVEVARAPRVGALGAFLLPFAGQPELTVALTLLGAAVLGGLGALWRGWRGV